MNPKVSRVIDLCVKLARARTSHRISGGCLEDVVVLEEELREHFPSLSRVELHRLVGVVVEAASLSLMMALGQYEVPETFPVVSRTVRIQPTTRNLRRNKDVGVQTPEGILPFPDLLRQIVTTNRWWKSSEIVAEFDQRQWLILTNCRRPIEYVRGHMLHALEYQSCRKGRVRLYRRKKDWIGGD